MNELAGFFYGVSSRDALRQVSSILSHGAPPAENCTQHPHTKPDRPTRMQTTTFAGSRFARFAAYRRRSCRPRCQSHTNWRSSARQAVAAENIFAANGLAPTASFSRLQL
jgi:hypothetical protein